MEHKDSSVRSGIFEQRYKTFGLLCSLLAFSALSHDIKLPTVPLAAVSSTLDVKSSGWTRGRFPALPGQLVSLISVIIAG